MASRINLKVLLALVTVALQVVACGNRPSNSGVAKPTRQPQETSNPSVNNQAAFPKGQEPELKLFPVDEASEDPSFEHFRNNLLAAARKQDSSFILEILDQHILNSFGGSGGIEEFRERNGNWIQVPMNFGTR